ASAGIPATSPSPGVADSPAGIADPVSDLLSMLDASDAATTSASSASAEPPSPSTTATTSLPHLTPTTPASMPAPAKATPSGEAFIAWLKQGIESRKLIINDAKALVHTVDGTAYLVSPGVFQRYV